MGFNAKLTHYLNEQEKAEAIALENVFLGITKDWKERHKDKELIMMGRPQHVTDKSLFAQARYLIIPTQDEKSISGVDYLVRKAAVEGVPTDKFIWQTISLSMKPIPRLVIGVRQWQGRVLQSSLLRTIPAIPVLEWAC